MDKQGWVKRDLAHIWHPCMQMKDFETTPLLNIERAEGCYLYTTDGNRLLDATGSWWCKSLGHSHPLLQNALKQQLSQFEHVILANTTNPTIIELGERLSTLTQHWQTPLTKVQFASDGSCAVEIALKMSLHAHQLMGQAKRVGLAALQNAYHGETALTLSVSDLGLYKTPYQPWMQPTTLIQGIPYVNTMDDPLWYDCSSVWPQIEAQLNPLRNTLTAFIVEPILQASAGMKLYSADFLKRLSAWCRANQVHLIADEVMTGIGRTGYPLACEWATTEADFVCLSKSLTAGMIPMSVCLSSQKIYDLFYDDYETQKAFMHSHTHSGNALAAAVAVANLTLMQTENYYQRVRELAPQLFELMQSVAQQSQALTNIRCIGAVVAADLIPQPHLPKRLGQAVHLAALELGALLRPLGNTLYWLPPFNIDPATLEQLHDITLEAIRGVYK